MDVIREIKRGSFTVEAAGLMGAVLLVIFVVLYMEFYVMDRDWLTIAAYEAALTGGMEERMEEGASWTVAEEKGRLLGNTGFFGLQGLKLGVSGGDTVTVTYTGQVRAILGGYQSDLSCTGSYKVVKPVSVIRNIRVLKAIGSMVKGSD